LVGHRTAQFFGVSRVVVYKRSDVSDETFALIYILKAGGESFCRTSAEWPLCRCTVDVTARGANGSGSDTGQGALVRTSLDSKGLCNDGVSSSDCVVSIRVFSEFRSCGDRWSWPT